MSGRVETDKQPNITDSMKTEPRKPIVETAGPAPSDGWGEAPPPPEFSWLSRIRWRAIQAIPTFTLRFFTAPYIAGPKRKDALAVAKRLYDERGIHSTIDVLGESVYHVEETQEPLEEYLQLIDDIGRSDHITVSIKLSALGQIFDRNLCEQLTRQILERAAKYDQFVRYDMEDHTTIDATLAIYKKFIGDFPRTGIVLQSMLFRTPDDYDKLAHLRPNVRGVIGIYREPANIAFTDKPTMKEKLLLLFEKMWAAGSYVAIATHDRNIVNRALALAEKMGKTTDDYEVQMLLGVPLNRFQDDLVSRGIRVKLYVPYGKNWAAYCRRRMNANPSIAGLALRNFLRIGQ